VVALVFVAIRILLTLFLIAHPRRPPASQRQPRSLGSWLRLPRLLDRIGREKELASLSTGLEKWDSVVTLQPSQLRLREPCKRA
jgi:hypothetical protein